MPIYRRKRHALRILNNNFEVNHPDNRNYASDTKTIEPAPEATFIPSIDRRDQVY